MTNDAIRAENMADAARHAAGHTYLRPDLPNCLIIESLPDQHIYRLSLRSGGTIRATFDCDDLPAAAVLHDHLQRSLSLPINAPLTELPVIIPTDDPDLTGILTTMFHLPCHAVADTTKGACKMQHAACNPHTPPPMPAQAKDNHHAPCSTLYSPLLSVVLADPDYLDALSATELADLTRLTTAATARLRARHARQTGEPDCLLVEIIVRYLTVPFDCASHYILSVAHEWPQFLEGFRAYFVGALPTDDVRLDYRDDQRHVTICPVFAAEAPE